MWSVPLLNSSYVKKLFLVSIFFSFVCVCRKLGLGGCNLEAPFFKWIESSRCRKHTMKTNFCRSVWEVSFVQYIWIWCVRKETPPNGLEMFWVFLTLRNVWFVSCFHCSKSESTYSCTAPRPFKVLQCFPITEWRGSLIIANTHVRSSLGTLLFDHPTSWEGQVVGGLNGACKSSWYLFRNSSPKFACQRTFFP